MPLREHNVTLENEKQERYTKLSQITKRTSDSNFMKFTNAHTPNSTRGRRWLGSSKGREISIHKGLCTESEMKIRRRLEFNIKKVPKEPKEGFNINLCGEILKSRKQLREFQDYGKIFSESLLRLSTVLDKESLLELLFARLRDSIRTLKSLGRENDDVVRFTIYFKTRDEPEPADISDKLTDIEAELLSDLSESDNDSIGLEDELLVPSNSRVSAKVEQATGSDTGRNSKKKDAVPTSVQNISSSKEQQSSKKRPGVTSIDTIKFLQSKIKERNEKMKEMRRLKVIRNSFKVNKNGVKSDKFKGRSSVKVEYSYSENIEMEEVVTDY